MLHGIFSMFMIFLMVGLFYWMIFTDEGDKVVNNIADGVVNIICKILE